MKNFASACSLAVLLGSCAPSTPQTRIAENPGKFASLTAREKSLVERGELARGMPPAAVELAWGPPSNRFEGSKEGKSTERWDYESSRPVYTTTFGGGYGYGYGYGYGRYGRRYPYSSWNFALGPELTYIPYRRASVWFVRDNVDSWERIR